MYSYLFQGVPSRPCHCRWACLLALAWTMMGLVGAHAQQALTLEQALQLAQSRSRQLVAQDALEQSSREMAVAAGQRPDPTLKLGVNNLPINGEDRLSLTQDFMTMRSIGVMQEFTRSDKLQARAARFSREAEAAQSGRAVVLATLRRETAMAWLDRYYLERMREVLHSQRVEASLQVEASDAAYRGGRGSQTDAFAARMAVALINDRIQQTERQLGTAKTRLARWIGEAADQPLAAPPHLDEAHLDLAGLESRLAHHPDIAWLVRQETVAQAEVDVAQSNMRSDWSVELMYNQRGPAYANMVSVNLSIPLQWDPKSRQTREVAAKQALAEQMRAQREEATRERMAQARAALQQWQADRVRLAHFDSVLLPLATERTRAAMAAYRGASGLLTTVLEARRMEIDTRMDRLRLEMEAASLWAQLAYMFPAEHPATADRHPSSPTTTTATEQ